MMGKSGTLGAKSCSDQAANPARSGSKPASLARTFILLLASPAMAVLALPVAFASRRPYQRLVQFSIQSGEIALNPAVAPDQYVIMIRQTLVRQPGTQQFTKAALHPVTHHRIANFLGNGDAVSFAFAAIGLRQKHETGACNAQAPVRSKKISTAR
jgi:hypothetical protein